MCLDAEKVYLVGGAVRDQLLKLPVKDRDWVVLGSSPAELLAAGFAQADADFPVFLHPETGEEYALARREHKTGEGYRGFVIDASPDVSLQEDLARRDLTINAIARDPAGQLIDPFDGQRDLDQRRLRHITPAFAEDPLRILRVARFAATLGGLGFRVAHATHRLMCQMVQAGAMAELLPQRIGREMRKALSGEQPWRFFEVLQACGGLQALAPGLAQRLVGKAHASGQGFQPIQALQRASAAHTDPAIRFAALFLAAPDTPEQLRQRLEPGEAGLGLLRAAREVYQVLAGALDVNALYEVFQRHRAWQRGGRFDAILPVLAAQPGCKAKVDRCSAAREAAMAVDSRQLADQGYQGAALGEAIERQRRQAIALVLGDDGAA